MTLQQFEKHLEALDQEADAIFTLFSSMPAWRLHMLGQMINDELVYRSEGKPCDHGQLH